MTIQFGLHYLMPCAEAQTPVQLYRETLEQAIRSESLGFESVWPVEQHFEARASVSPCPTLLLAAIAARTQRLRLGTAIIQLPLSHPLRVAEEIATLDVLSGGRVDLGVGRGSTPYHFNAFGVPLHESRARFEEGLQVVRAALTEPRMSFHGKFFDISKVAIAPAPVQRPVPIRVAANTPETFEYAGREGLPLIAASHVNPWSKLRELLPRYHEARRAAGHKPATPDDITLLTPVFVDADRDRIAQVVAPSIAHYVDLVTNTIAPSIERAPNAEQRTMLLKIVERMGSTTLESMRAESGIFDTPAVCIERLKEVTSELGAGRVITWFNFGGLVPHAEVLRSMTCFSEEVMPAFA